MMVVPASSLSRCEMHMLGSNVIGAVQHDLDARASVNRSARFREGCTVLAAPTLTGRIGGSAKPARMAS